MKIKIKPTKIFHEKGISRIRAFGKLFKKKKK